jgi:hypothetical protein
MKVMRTSILLGALVAVTAVGLAACGGGAPSSAAGPAGGSRAAGYARLIAYSRCMRAHGAPNYPDPVNNGSGIGVNIDDNSPQVQAAEHACRALAPPGPTAAQQAQNLARELNFSRCMRSHGVLDYPDPASDGSMNIGGTGYGKGSPQFRRAYQACRSDLGSGGPEQQSAGGP